MTIQETITSKLQASLDLTYCEVINESENHNVPPGSESHFKLTLVSPDFENKTLIAQHRVVNSILKDELQDKIHALALHTYTPAEWQSRNSISPDSPPCLGGGKE